MGFAHAPPALCIVFAGASYSLLPSSLYPLLPEYVPGESFTTVYAILNSLINLVFTVVLAIAGGILGNSDTSSLGGTRWGARWGAPRGLQEHGGGGEELGHKFDYVFAMFITITLLGTGITGMLAVDAWRHGTGGPLSKKHGH